MHFERFTEMELLTTVPADELIINTLAGSAYGVSAGGLQIAATSRRL